MLAPVFDESNPLSVGSLLPIGLKTKLKQLVREQPEMFEKSEQELDKLLVERGAQPTPLDNRLRLAFWHEYDASCLAGRHMNLSNICAGLMSLTYFSTKYLNHAEKAAWMLLPPVKYDVLVTESLHHGLNKLRDLLDISIYNPKTGMPDPRLIDCKIKIVAMLDMRMKGAFVEKRLNVNIQKNINEELTKINMEDLEEQIRKLEGQSSEPAHTAKPEVHVSVDPDADLHPTIEIGNGPNGGVGLEFENKQSGRRRRG